MPDTTAQPHLQKEAASPLTLRNILIRTHKRAKELGARIERKVCQLAVESRSEHELTDEHFEVLQAVAAGDQAFDSIRNEHVGELAYRRFHDKAEKMVVAEYAASLGQPRHRKTAWEVVIAMFFEAAERLVEGFKVYPTSRDWMEGRFWWYCESLTSGKKHLSDDQAELFRRAVETLETPEFICDLQDRLARECQQEAASLGLALAPPHPPLIPALGGLTRNDIKVDESKRTIQLGEGPVVRPNASNSWDIFIRLWKSAGEPVDVAKVVNPSDARNVIADLKRWLRKNGLEALAPHIRLQRGVGYYFDL